MRFGWGFLLLTLLALCAPAQQDQGFITGIVRDRSGGILPDAAATARELRTNIPFTARTNQSGVYVLGPLKVGVYELSVERAGFKTAVLGGIELHSSDRLGLDIELEVGEIVETVTVEASTPILVTESATLSYTVQRRPLEKLPLNGRSYQSLALLSAGVAPEIAGRDRGPMGTSSFGNGLIVHGQPALQNNFLIDGIDNNSTVMGLQDRKAQAVVPSLDAVQEFKVQTSNYSAEFGRNAGGVIQISIRSGSNDFHGSAYEFIRNDVFDARTAFGRNDRDGDGKADPAVLRQNQFGATLGGPVVRDRSFFFGSWEAWRVSRAQSDQVVVPTALEKSKDFSGTRGLGELRDPLGGLFPNRRIPAARFDTV